MMYGSYAAPYLSAGMGYICLDGAACPTAQDAWNGPMRYVRTRSRRVCRDEIGVSSADEHRREEEGRREDGGILVCLREGISVRALAREDVLERRDHRPPPASSILQPPLPRPLPAAHLFPQIWRYLESPRESRCTAQNQHPAPTSFLPAILPC
ncbi:hypothetical protein FIBSPDRAFT_428468 [Athelia psychrophila]|uniref:Uncharacterized protein n=1 Tax=Athelia psychrophila TaxID=1759441 RepID=A0A167UL49_9AGAM|nr:hypothetical protein FIBSPDRAFT_428468 [Fibularhizoctonia sp. CBS 109695]